MDRMELLRRTFGGPDAQRDAPAIEGRAAKAPAAAPPPPAERHTLTLRLAPGEAGYLRRSSLMMAEGDFSMTTERIASRRVPLLGFLNGQAMWANRFEAGAGPVRLVAARDYHGVVAGLDVTPDVPVHVQPGLYLGHTGALSFEVRRVRVRREFWTLTRVTGAGTVHLKVPGRAFSARLSARELIVDTNHVAAIRGPFEADGKVFSRARVLKSGESENVRLTGPEGGASAVLLQTEVPQAASGGGGLFGGLLDLFV